jgi:hypothetical protein
MGEGDGEYSPTRTRGSAGAKGKFFPLATDPDLKSILS